MKKVMLYPNPTRDIDLLWASRVAEILIKFNICVTMPDLILHGLSVPEERIANIAVMPFEKAVESADMVVSLGGDGSILHTAQQAAVHNIPVLGINVGRMGYMAELETDELEWIEKIIRGNYTTEERMMLDVEIHRGERIIYKNIGLNDAVIAKVNYANTVDLDIYTDEFFISHYQGDGVIVATPTGSTAYSMSAGGPIVDPLSSNMIITPVCTHSLSAKPIVLSPKRKITIQALSEPSGIIGMSLDGAEVKPLEKGDRVVIKKSDFTTKLIRVKDKNFYDILCSKLSDRRFGDK